jgi:hypothetical protein
MVVLLVTAVAGLATLFVKDALVGALVRARYPRIILVTLDTLHVDHTGPYNEAVDYTPTLDRFAAAGVTFDRAYTTVPITLPSHASLLTGRTPPDLGVMVNGDVLTTPAETLAERLSTTTRWVASGSAGTEPPTRWSRRRRAGSRRSATNRSSSGSTCPIPTSPTSRRGRRQTFV